MQVDPGSSKHWLPLGGAQIIDWKHLERASSARGATAWASYILDEPLLLRSWCNESTTFFEFFFLGHESLSGTVVVSTERPEPSRIRLRVSAEIENQLSYLDETEFVENPRTGLYGRVSRETTINEGELTGHSPATPLHAEVFEYAPESTLHTKAGDWLWELFYLMLLGRGEENQGLTTNLADPLPVASGLRASIRSRSPGQRIEADASGINIERSVSMSSPSGSVQVPPAAPKLFVSTQEGERWEVGADEAFIGRSKNCEIVLKSQRVSRKHASVSCEPDGFYLNDQGAANGIWSGQEKVTRERIEDGAEYIIGDVPLRFHF